MAIRVFIGEALTFLHVHHRWVLLGMLFGMSFALSAVVIPLAQGIGDNSISSHASGALRRCGGANEGKFPEQAMEPVVSERSKPLI